MSSFATLGLTAIGTPFAASLVLAALVVVLSVVPLGAARSQSNFTMADLQAPRAMFERLPAWGKRASWAHQNSFEAFSLHAPACLLCLLAGVDAPLAVLVAWLHPLLRLIYIPAFVANVPPLRALCWATGLVCSAVLYLEGLRAVLAS
ncbi:MAG: MAPEG family protein [Synechococcus lacustris]